MTRLPPLRALIVDDEPMARTHLRTLLAARDDIEVAGECGSGLAAVDLLRQGDFDLVLLDIQMPERDGLEVVRDVGYDRMPPVIFVTAYDEYALDAFEVHALDYLLKPVNRERFGEAIDRVVRVVRGNDVESMRGPLGRLVDYLSSSRDDLERLAVKVDGRIVMLKVADIDWIEAADDYVRLHVGTAAYLHRDTMTRLERRLPRENFMRVHRSTIVNLQRIRELQPWFQGDWVLILGDGTRLHTGRNYREAIREFLARAQ
ncbi:MAG TPA: LytTR family DNA-binding domain-containing protein [Gemmatimonadaceae bacterium]|nr:LytTR family DNA-binding domain-containing protein [Gemmatimonadaceae bacterium]